MRFFNIKNKSSGFTLIELLVVIAVIGILSSVVLASLNSARTKGRDARRKSDMKQVQLALEMYFDDNSAYPSTSNVWWGVCDNGLNKDTSGASAYIPGLTPSYISVLPLDPLDVRTGWNGYLYKSDGINYKLISIYSPESYPGAGDVFYDPTRPTWSWKLCSAEPACSSW